MEEQESAQSNPMDSTSNTSQVSSEHLSDASPSLQPQDVYGDVCRSHIESSNQTEKHALEPPIEQLNSPSDPSVPSADSVLCPEKTASECAETNISFEGNESVDSTLSIEGSPHERSERAQGQTTNSSSKQLSARTTAIIETRHSIEATKSAKKCCKGWKIL